LPVPGKGGAASSFGGSATGTGGRFGTGGVIGVGAFFNTGGAAGVVDGGFFPDAAPPPFDAGPVVVTTVILPPLIGIAGCPSPAVRQARSGNLVWGVIRGWAESNGLSFDAGGIRFAQQGTEAMCWSVRSVETAQPPGSLWLYGNDCAIEVPASKMRVAVAKRATRIEDLRAAGLDFIQQPVDWVDRGGFAIYRNSSPAFLGLRVERVYEGPPKQCTIGTSSYAYGATADISYWISLDGNFSKYAGAPAPG
jgi:hypothetical protein